MVARKDNSEEVKSLAKFIVLSGWDNSLVSLSAFDKREGWRRLLNRDSATTSIGRTKKLVSRI